MSIPFSKIEELIEVCKAVDEKVYEDDYDKRIHVRDIAATLQKLIDDELEEMEAMAKHFIEQDKGNPDFALEEEIPYLPE